MIKNFCWQIKKKSIKKIIYSFDKIFETGSISAYEKKKRNENLTTKQILEYKIKKKNHCTSIKIGD